MAGLGVKSLYWDLKKPVMRWSCLTTIILNGGFANEKNDGKYDVSDADAFDGVFHQCFCRG